MFPVRLRNGSDPMTGFFALRTASIDLVGLQPRGFKILLEILAREPLAVTEVPFDFGERAAGESKATCVKGCASSPSSAPCASAGCRGSP